jgi:stalled ribosome rescue protein Dom34
MDCGWVDKGNDYNELMSLVRSKKGKLFVWSGQQKIIDALETLLI